jgi:hypothetical protein
MVSFIYEDYAHCNKVPGEEQRESTEKKGNLTDRER